MHGTVNDLAVGGATPLFLSAAFILEEGLPLADLKRIVARCDRRATKPASASSPAIPKSSIAARAIRSSSPPPALALFPKAAILSIHNARPGDVIIVSGTIGDHGIAIMSVREGIEFETVLESDSAPLDDLTRVMLDACPTIRCMRDPTRGGVSSALNELADASKVGVRLNESTLPLRPEVKAACEMLGLDPLYVANEGKLIAVVPAGRSRPAVGRDESHPLGRNAAVIGEIVDDHPGMVVMKSLVGGQRVVTMIAGEQLPRIC